jgi:hypothetical protein
MLKIIGQRVSGRGLGRSLAAASVAVALLAACGNSAPKAGGLGTNPAVTTKAPIGSDTTSSSGSSDTTSSSGSSDTTKAGTGGSGPAAFCAAFDGVSKIKVDNAADWPAAVAQLKKYANDIRNNAPAEIAGAAKAYADLFDAIAAAGTDPTAYAKQYSDYFSKHTAEITAMAVWVGTNCKN